MVSRYISKPASRYKKKKVSQKVDGERVNEGSDILLSDNLFEKSDDE